MLFAAVGQSVQSIGVLVALTRARGVPASGPPPRCLTGTALAPRRRYGILGDDGVVVAIHGTSQDITERKPMEEALRAREVQLTEAQRVARLGWWELDLATERVVWPQEMYLLCEMEPGDESRCSAAPT